MIINYIRWDVDPEIFHIGSFVIRWYGVLFASAFLIGYFIMQSMFKKEGIPLKTLDYLSTYMVVGTIAGARLGHCLFYEPEYYLSNPLDILKIWEGGLASHGGAIGILIALYLFTRKYKFSFLWLMDRVVIGTALGGFLIRMGNLMNSEIFGVPTELPWGFEFVRAVEGTMRSDPRHPTQIYEALSYLLIFIYLITYYYRKKGKPERGYLFGIFLILLFTSRFFIEFLKVPQVGFEQSLMLNMGQLLSIPFVIAGVFLVKLHSLRRWR